MHPLTKLICPVFALYRQQTFVI